MGRRSIPLALLSGAVAVACADPTAIDVTVYSEVPCSAQAEVALSVAGDPPSLANAAPASVATRCDALGDGTVRRGNVVIVPQGDKEKSIAFELTTRNDGQPLDPCATDPKGCIVARRQLRFQSTKTTQVRVDLRLSCLGVACPLDQTCVSSRCVPAQLEPCDSCGEPDAGGVVDPPTAVTAAPVAVGVVTTVAGSGNAAFADGTGVLASFNQPSGVALDAAGNLYVADTSNERVRKTTSAGVVTTVAGSGSMAFADGVGAAASFYTPEGVTVDSGGTVYVADYGNQRIRKVTSDHMVTTLAGSGTQSYADGMGASASFCQPAGVVVNASGDVYVADGCNNRIRRVTSAGVVTTLAGSGAQASVDGTGAAAGFNLPIGLAIDGAGNIIVGDANGCRIRKVTSAGVVTTIAGGMGGFADGVGVAARFSGPAGVAVDSAGNVYVADRLNERVRRITSAGVVTTLAGSAASGKADGIGALASFSLPSGVALDGAGNLYVADTFNHLIRRVTTAGFGELAVSWVASPGAVKGYVASAAAGAQPTETCGTSGPTTCTITGLTSGVAYSVTVVATTAVGTSAPSVASLATPN